jgi:hypothetical protein
VRVLNQDYLLQAQTRRLVFFDEAGQAEKQYLIGLNGRGGGE